MTKTLCTLLLVGTLSSVSFAQHSDIEFGYDDHTNPTAIEIEQPNVSSEGFQFFESEFERATTSDPWETDEPGFETIDEMGELFRFNPGDNIWISVLNAGDDSISDLGVGYVNYFNPGTGVLEASGEITVGEDLTSATADLVLNGASITSGDNPQLLGIGDTIASGDPGGIHEHVGFELTGDTVGAYGLLLQVQADFAGTSADIDLVSDPFWVIINRGLDEAVFEDDALGAFGIVEAVPEPASAVLLTGVFGAMFIRRRRQS